MDAVIEGLRSSGINLKPKFEKYRYVELIAADNNLVLGRYENVAFLFSKGDIELTCDCLKKVIVEITQADESFNEFKFGKFKIKDKDLTRIKLDVRFNKELFYDLIPALQIEMLRADILLNQCNLQAQAISEEESEIIKKVSVLSDSAKRSIEVSELEHILSEVSTFHVDFFRKFMHFKDVNEEIFSSIIKFEAISRSMGDWFSEKVTELRNSHESLKYYESKFEQTLNGVRDLFSLLSLRLDMLRNREYLELERRTSSLQAAAVVIEFIAVFYYTLKSWEYFMPVDKMPTYLSFLLLSIFTVSVVAYTEVLGELIREKKASLQFVLITILIAILLFLMYYVPVIFSKV